VISPLIALMQDQGRTASADGHSRGVPEQRGREADPHEIRRKAMRASTGLMYLVTGTSGDGEHGRLAEEVPVSFFAIDEAH